LRRAAATRFATIRHSVRTKDPSTIEGFLRLAERYCEWFESVPIARVGESERELQWREGLAARRSVAELYAWGTRLDEVDWFMAGIVTDSAGNEHVDVGGVESRYVPGALASGDADSLRKRLCLFPMQYYVEPLADGFELDMDSELGLGDLCDDLLDIWQDLRRGLEEWRAGRPAQALWEWRFGFDHHWGRHAGGARKALQEFIESSGYSKGDGDRS
jgi:hypothetical protein